MHNKILGGHCGKDVKCRQCFGFHRDVQSARCFWSLLGVFQMLVVGNWEYHGVGCFWLGGFMGAFGFFIVLMRFGIG
jgi:hypothetical protein